MDFTSGRWTHRHLSCAWCNQLFSDRLEILLHTRLLHGFNCNSCPREIDNLKDFLKHAQYCEYSKLNIDYFEKCATKLK